MLFRSGPMTYIDPLGLWSWRGFGKAVVEGLGGGIGGAVGALAGGAVGVLAGPEGAVAGAWFGGIFCGSAAAYASGEAYDELTDPDNVANLGWELDNPPPPVRSKPICVRGCHRELWN